MADPTDQYDPIFKEAGEAWQIDPLLLKALVKHESGGRPDAAGTSGEVGLGQFMPDTAKRIGITNRRDPEQSIWGAAKLMNEALIAERENPYAALRYYNGGSGWRSGRGDPNYPSYVGGQYQKFAKANTGSMTDAGPAPAPAEATPGAKAPADMTDTEWLDAQSKTYPGLAGPNAQPHPADTGKGAAVPATKPADKGEDDAFTRALNAPEKPAAAAGGAATSAEPDAFTRALNAPGEEEKPTETAKLTDPSTWHVPQGDAPARIRQAASEAFANAPSMGTTPGNMSVFTPEAQNWLDRNIPIAGHYLINPAGQLVGTAIGAGAAVGAAAVQTGRELATEAGVPANLQRDLTMMGQVAPAAAVMPQPLGRFGDLHVLSPEAQAAAAKSVPVATTGGVTTNALDEVAARQAAREAVRPVGEAKPSGATSPTGVEGPRPPPEGYVAPPQATGASASAMPPPGQTPRTSAEAKAVAGVYYDKADQTGGTLTPEFTNRFIDEARKIAPQTPEGAAVTGDTAATKLNERIAALQDQPVTLRGAQEIDEGLGDLIDKEYGPRGISKQGKQLVDLQSRFRNMIADAGPGDIEGGSEGFAALVHARKAWSQAMKMSDLERIQERAMGQEQPSTGIRTGIRTLLGNAARVRGYSPDELAALDRARTRGLLGDAFHVFGSRLVPLVAGTGGLAGSGPVGAAIAAGSGQVLATGSRAVATALQNRRLNSALATLGRKVPPHPLQP
jgi:hypothetical protein